MMKISYTHVSLLFYLLVFSSAGLAQEQKIQNYLETQREQLGLTAQDIQNWNISDDYLTQHNGVRHVYITQMSSGIEVFGAQNTIVVSKEGDVIWMTNRFIPDLKNKVNSTQPSISMEDAIRSAAQHFDLDLTTALIQLENKGANYAVYAPSSISLENIPVELMFMEHEGEIKLAWNLSIYTTDAKNWWNTRVDALTGEVLGKDNWVTHCKFDGPNHTHSDHCQHEPSFDISSVQKQLAANGNANHINAPDSYRVFEFPVESPNHGSRSLVVNPAGASSPFGWHDTNGAAGAEYTITRGNNVYAYEDISDNNSPGYSPDGTASLDFDFPFDPTLAPVSNQDAAITNLFYVNNVMHDVLFAYGFDEVSGNFQTTNYSGQGNGGDEVTAEAMDGGGTNNANFGTPPDGSNPRMQMFLWTGAGPLNYVTVNSPAVIAGGLGSTGAGFGPGIPTTPLSGNLILVDDGVAAASVSDACEPIVNGSAINGNFALIDRGDCTFADKVVAAQNEGATAVIICNNVASAPITMGGANAAVTIPSAMISQSDCVQLKFQLSQGNTVNVTLEDNFPPNVDRDGDFDNGVIAHEYGHGVSNRLTGGPSNTSCLGNEEQMGEGWSDYLGMMLTMKATDTRTTVRGVGTFADGQPTSGFGIRPFPYTTDMSINPFTYSDISGVSVPHGVGSVWCTMLWDMTWDLIDQYGFDPDMANGTGGNNIAMQLVIDGMKMQSCNPGFIDGRDAILMADVVNNNGVNQCLIWEAFAKRGLGYSASQGSSNNVADGSEGYDVAPACNPATVAPTADFIASPSTSCTGQVMFEDQSIDVAQSWLWNFGDGNTSTLQNPTHTYTTDGTYTVSLTVTNTIGSDSEIKTNYVVVDRPDAPTNISNGNACEGESATLSASGNGTILWYQNGVQVGTGSPFSTPPLSSTLFYEVVNAEFGSSVNVGPVNNAFGGGGYHGTTFTGTVDFTAGAPFRLVSVWVDADGAGNRDIQVLENGAVVRTVTVNIPDGTSRVTLNLDFDTPGNYSLGGTGVDLYRNNSGATYPYDFAGLVTLTGSSAGPDFYYYFYDWEVQPLCLSPGISLTAGITNSTAIPSFTFVNNNLAVDFTDVSAYAVSWDWDFGDGSVSSDQNPSHTYSVSGAYPVTLTVSDGTCSISSTQTVVVSSGTGTGTTVVGSESVQIYPNPVTEAFTVVVNGNNLLLANVKIFSMNGQLIQSVQDVNIGTGYNMDVSSLPSAVYFIEVQTEKSTIQKRILKK